MQQMINKIPLSQCTLTIQFTRDLVSTLGYTGICDLVSPTPLEQLLEDGGSLPASKRVSGTQARSWIEGVWVPRSLQHRRLSPVLLEFPKWRLTYWQMVSTS